MRTALPPVEEILFSAIDQKQFWECCRNAFSGQSGVELRKALLAISHPLYPPVGADALETYRLIGRAEIVSLLLRYSEAELSPATLQNHVSTNERATGGTEGR